MVCMAMPQYAKPLAARVIPTTPEMVSDKKEMMAFLKLSDRKSFDKLYLKPLLNKRIRYTVPDKPNSRIQKYVAIGES